MVFPIKQKNKISKYELEKKRIDKFKTMLLKSKVCSKKRYIPKGLVQKKI